MKRILQLLTLLILITAGAFTAPPVRSIWGWGTASPDNADCGASTAGSLYVETDVPQMWVCATDGDWHVITGGGGSGNVTLQSGTGSPNGSQTCTAPSTSGITLYIETDATAIWRCDDTDHYVLLNESSGTGGVTFGGQAGDNCPTDIPSGHFCAYVDSGVLYVKDDTETVISQTNTGGSGASAGSGTDTTLSGANALWSCTGICAINPPPLVSGAQFCVRNEPGVSSVITLNALGGSAMYELPDHSAFGTAGTGTLYSGGSTSDSACFWARDTTHYLIRSIAGTWMEGMGGGGGCTPATGYSYCVTMTIPQQPSTLTDFPVLLAGNARLKTTGNGGQVQSGSGFDIYPTDSMDTALGCTVQSWSASTGDMVMWVKQTLSSSTTTDIKLNFGKTGVVSSPCSSTAAWDTNYKGVYPLNDNAANTTVTEYVNSHTGTNVANTSTKSVAGPFNGGTLGTALSYNGSSDATDLTSTSDYDFTGSFSIQFWVKFDSLATFVSVVDRSMSDGSAGWFLAQANQAVAPGQLTIRNPGIGNLANSTATVTTGAWASVSVTHVGGSSTAEWSINGITGSDGFINALTATTTAYIGRNAVGDAFTAGDIAHLRLSNTARSADWVAAEYSNQNAPESWYSVTW